MQIILAQITELSHLELLALTEHSIRIPASYQSDLTLIAHTHPFFKTKLK